MFSYKILNRFLNTPFVKVRLQRGGKYMLKANECEWPKAITLEVEDLIYKSRRLDSKSPDDLDDVSNKLFLLSLLLVLKFNVE